MNEPPSGGLAFKYGDGRAEVAFHYASWLKLIKAIIVKFANRTREEAERLVSSSQITNTPPENSGQAGFLSHEYEYHWAMLIAHGEGYWRHGVPYPPPDSYWEWEQNYRSENGLPEESFGWKD